MTKPCACHANDPINPSTPKKMEMVQVMLVTILCMYALPFFFFGRGRAIIPAGAEPLGLVCACKCARICACVCVNVSARARAYMCLPRCLCVDAEQLQALACKSSIEDCRNSQASHVCLKPPISAILVPASWVAWIRTMPHVKANHPVAHSVRWIVCRLNNGPFYSIIPHVSDRKEANQHNLPQHWPDGEFF